MRHRIFSALFIAILALVLLGLASAFGVYDQVGMAAGLAITLGIILVVAVGSSLMTVIRYGRRSRRDEAVHRTARDDDYR
jgi:formate/nitrite transporter FocA (FNT family)